MSKKNCSLQARIIFYSAGLFNRMCAQVAPSGECLSDRMLAKPWRRLFLAAYTIWAKLGCHCCPAC